MMIAIIVDNYTLNLKLNGGGIQTHHVDDYRDAWAALDPDATGFVHVKHLSTLIRGLAPPLGLDPRLYPNSVVRDVDIMRYVFQLDVRREIVAPRVTPLLRHRHSLSVICKHACLQPLSIHSRT